MTSADFAAALKSLGIRQKWLAEQLGIARSTVSRWATGELPVPQYAVAYVELLSSLRKQGLTGQLGSC